MLVMYLERTTRTHTSAHCTHLDATHLSMDEQSPSITKPNPWPARQVQVPGTGWAIKERPLEVAFLL